MSFRSASSRFCWLCRFANSDLLTNMQNRSAYESGHEKGDRMLQTVALEMMNLFGKDNCYRTGGDEFVAFVQDKQENTVRAMVNELTGALEREDYSAAIAWPARVRAALTWTP